MDFAPEKNSKARVLREIFEEIKVLQDPAAEHGIGKYTPAGCDRPTTQKQREKKAEQRSPAARRLIWLVLQYATIKKYGAFCAGLQSL